MPSTSQSEAITPTTRTTQPNHNDTRISTAEQRDYWAQMTADDDGMLGGYPQVSRVDVQFSLAFLRKLIRIYPPPPTPDDGEGEGDGQKPKKKFPFRRCLESGAGIGRVTANLLSQLCEQIDVIEPMEKFTAVLTSPESPLVKAGQLGRVWNVPLQEWNITSTPAYASPFPSTPAGAYDLIYNQWCLNYLSNPSLVTYFRYISTLLTPTGWIIVKENISSAPGGKDMFWDEDSSVTRSEGNFRRVFEESGLVVVRTQVQTGFPRSLLAVRMYALRPGEG